MKVLVTGGGGFLGCHIVELLQQRGYEVRAIGRRPQPVLESRGVEFFCGNLARYEDIGAAAMGVEAIFHVAGRAKLDMNSRAYYETNVLGTKNVIQACKDYGVHYLIYTSSPAVVFNGDAFSGDDERLPYGMDYPWDYSRTKAIAEASVLENNSAVLKTVALRPHLMLGEGDPHLIPNILRLARAHQLRIVGDGNNQVDITFVKNAAQAHLLALDALVQGDQASGKAYFIGQERPIMLWEFINTILENLGMPKVEKRIPFSAAYYLGALCEVWYKLFNRSSMPPMTRAMAVALSKDHYFSHERARQDLKYEPQVTLDQGTTELIRSLRLQMKVLELKG